MTPRRIAIACQGGGINAAFTYGVLRQILTELEDASRQGSAPRFEIIALSGTSAGALCAFMTWYGLAASDPTSSGPAAAIAALDSLWETFAATTPSELAFNMMVVQSLRAQARGLPSVKISPYALLYQVITPRLDLLGMRPEFYDFSALLKAVAPNFARIDQRQASPRLFIGAVDVLSGSFEAFDSWEDPATKRNISLAAIEGSGTLPEVRKAEPIDGFVGADGVSRRVLLWDGLFSQNPPVREFVSRFPLAARPDEIWVIRINPQARTDAPMCPDEIEDRRNELSGNLSLNQELDFIKTVNDWCERFPELGCQRKKITLRTIKMRKSTVERLDLASKFDRSRSFIAALRKEGEERAAQWLARWPDQVDQWPQDAVYAAGDA